MVESTESSNRLEGVVVAHRAARAMVERRASAPAPAEVALPRWQSVSTHYAINSY